MSAKRKYMKDKTVSRKPLTLKSLFAKGALFAVFVVCVITILEQRRIFVEDDMNNHVEWKWDWYYRMKGYGIPIDVLFVGNSHLITGMNPYEFTRQSGLNSFILGASGVCVADLYYVIEEAVKVNKPKVIVLETYAINDDEPRKLEKGKLNDEINSFRARRNTWLKIASTPSLFDYHNYGIAWCETFRNHNYIFTKPDQILRNLKGEGPVRRVRDNVYLGQFARFSKGISRKTLERYETEGAPVDGMSYEISESSVKFTKKIAQLCEENGIRLVFLTVPMYQEHVKNYDVWRARIGECLNELSPYWLDLQYAQIKDAGMQSLYTTEAFQDTYEANQHLTNYGMAVTAGVFAEYLKHIMPDLPDRKNELQWQKLVSRFP